MKCEILGLGDEDEEEVYWDEKRFRKMVSMWEEALTNSGRIISCFPWALTHQGYDFWSRASNKIEPQLSDGRAILLLAINEMEEKFYGKLSREDFL